MGRVRRVGDVSDLVAAFPSVLRADAVAVAKAMPQTRLPATGPFTVRVEGESVFIPSRVYPAEPGPSALGKLSPVQRAMLACLYTRHHDGHVRQRYLAQVGELACGWVTPFVVQLIGEYVVRIVLDVRELLVGVEVAGSAMRAVYGRFAVENPQFLDLTYQRAVSYWDRYYRGWYARRQDYPAFEVLSSLRDVAREIERASG